MAVLVVALVAAAVVLKQGEGRGRGGGPSHSSDHECRLIVGHTVYHEMQIQYLNMHDLVTLFDNSSKIL